MTSDLMDSEAEALEEKLTSLLGQLQAESAILERMVYKNKNQHRRGSYFQYLMKVRRDLRLLQSTKLEEILGCCFQSITGKRPKQKVHLLESLKRRKCESGKYNFMERLLGAARLLSQMVEPMLKAATEISTLLARSFFMGFSLTILALLARLRVLVQQMVQVLNLFINSHKPGEHRTWNWILLDVVSVFNMVSSLSQKKQSIKINQGGLEVTPSFILKITLVFREFYPTNEEFIILECVLKSDKFELLESTHKSEIASHDGDLAVGASSVLYQSVESYLGGQYFNVIMEILLVESFVKLLTADANHTIEKVPIHVTEDKIGLLSGLSNDGTDGKLVEHCEDGSNIAETPSKKLSEEGCLLPGSSSPSSSDASKLRSGPVKVAFVQVKRPLPSTTNTTEIHFKETDIHSHNEEEDPLFSLLSSGNLS
ncbi:hypothetical protein Prudu_012371 [Prunus dulcis]|uniref:Nucleolus and neural progenitor protein-like N-terminal domain-containing protein n=1 Tax=Prunus dulcis TaxID=3755 RepID=A0A4Y1RCS4_PRUDU|nr:hypothetical protein Prudu_012371 [Prunus dulcis]